MGTFFKVFFIVALTDRNDGGRGSSSRVREREVGVEGG